MWSKRRKRGSVILPVQGWQPNLNQKFALLLLGWGVAALAAALCFGVWPRTGIGWIMIFVLGPFLLFLGEVWGEACKRKLDSARLSRKIAAVTKEQSFSGLRVAYGLVLALIFITQALVLGWLIWSFFPNQLELVAGFMRNHYHSF
jgi:hypothetical protein